MAEVDMIERVFDLDDTVVREVMVPRPDVVSVPSDASLSDLRTTILDTEHTRYPVVAADDPDRAVGFVDVKDVLRAVESGSTDTTAGDLARDVVVVPETTTVNDLLLQFRDERRRMAVVIDEWGVLEGIATVEDLVEAIVGDLRDEFDAERREHSVRRRDDGAYDVDGSVTLSTVNDALETAFEGDGFETLGGLVLDRLGRVPEVGDTVETADYVIEVTGVDGTRVSTLRITDGDGENDESTDTSTD
jgi:CBS domain containing-hemolysin-like protein